MTTTDESARFESEVARESDISHYFASTPFSSIGGYDYGSSLTKDFFREHFYVEGKLPKRKGMITEALGEGRRNIVLLSGYQGCGKTTFVHYLIDDIREEDESGMVGSTVIDLETEADPEEETPGSVNDAPSKFTLSLVRRIKNEAFAISFGGGRNAGEFERRRRAFSKVYGAVRGLIEGYCTEYSFFDFANAYVRLSRNPFPRERGELVDTLWKMPVRTLLFTLTFLLFCLDASDAGSARFRRVIVFDNMDDELDERKVSWFIKGFVGFSQGYMEFYNRLRDVHVEGLDFSDSGFHRNFAFFFCLRDTNVAKFTAHLEDRRVYVQCDISKDVPRGEILMRKLKYLKELDLEKNDELRRQADFFERLIEDEFVIDKVYPLFNNNHRKTTRALRRLAVSGDESCARERERLAELSRGRADSKAGANGIVLRLLTDGLRDEQHLRDIGGADEEMSIPRVILTLLYNKSMEHRGVIEPSNKMSLLEIKSELSCLGRDVDAVASCILQMYLLFNRDRWSHLLEIDTEYAADLSTLKREMNGEMCGRRPTQVYITCAGRNFVSVLSSHFEYFASRYAPDSSPLFSRRNLEVVGEELALENLLDKVYEQVSSCVDHVMKNDEKLKEQHECGSWGDFFKQPCVYTTRNGNKQTHAERIICSHLSYVDALRMRLLSLRGGRLLEEFSCDDPDLAERRRDAAVSLLVDAQEKYIDKFRSLADMKYITRHGKDLLEDFEAALDVVLRARERGEVSRERIGNLTGMRKDGAQA